MGILFQENRCQSNNYKIIKSTLDGSIQNQPKNIILYVTSNRRHLMPRDMIENERSSAIHTDESVEEKISLSDRFGLWIGFHNISQNDFINIISKYCEKFNMPFNKDTEISSLTTPSTIFPILDLAPSMLETLSKNFWGSFIFQRAKVSIEILLPSSGISAGIPSHSRIRLSKIFTVCINGVLKCNPASVLTLTGAPN